MRRYNLFDREGFSNRGLSNGEVVVLLVSVAQLVKFAKNYRIKPNGN